MSQVKLTADSGGGTTSLKGPSATTGNADVVLKLPVADGSSGQVLKTDGSGQLSFTSNAGTTINNNADNRVITGSGTANTLEGEANLTWNGTEFHASGSSGTPQLTIENTSNSAREARLNVIGRHSNGTVRQLMLKYDNADRFRIHTGGSLPIAFETADTERLRIDGSGRVLVGTTTEGHPAADDFTIENTASGADMGITLRSATNGQGAIYFSDGTSGDAEYRGIVNYNHSSDFLSFFTAASEGMRIDSSGNVHIGKTGSSFSTEGFSFRDGGSGAFFFQATRDGSGGTVVELNRETNVGRMIEFYRGSTNLVGHIESNNTSTSYNTSSDYRLKENVVAISDGITRLKTLKPYRFNFKVEKDTTVDGFLAHEVTAVPEAITGTKDEVDENNEPVYQGIDQSKLVPLLTAALQEEVAKREALEARVAALEAA